jgi:hypothetical protein
MVVYKIQYHNFEEGEFEKYEGMSQEKGVQLFRSIDWLKELGKKKEDDIIPAFIVEHEGYVIKIYPLNTGQMDLLYIPDQKVKILDLVKFYRKRDSIEELQKVMENFIARKFSVVQEACYEMNTVDGNKELRSTKDKDFTYKLSFTNDMSLLIYAVVYSILGIFILGVAMLVLKDLNFSLISLIGSFMAFVPLIVYVQFVLSNRNLEIFITRGNEYFTVKKNDEVKKYFKKDVSKIITFYNNGGRSPFNNTSSSNIIFQNGDQIGLTSLVIKEDALAKKFREHIAVKKHTMIPYLRNNIKL